MAKGRWVKAEFFEDEKIGVLDPAVRLTYLSLFHLADDKGRLQGNAIRVRGWVFMYYIEITVEQVEGFLKQLESINRIIRYKVNDEEFICVPRLLKHQSITNPTKSRLPAPPKDKLEELGFEERFIKELLDNKPWKGGRQPKADDPPEVNQAIKDVFEFWKTTMQMRSNTVCNDVRASRIRARLREGYSVEQLKKAILGNRSSEFHQEGGYRDIELICRGADKVDGFIAKYEEWKKKHGEFEEQTDIFDAEDVDEDPLFANAKKKVLKG